MTIIKTQRRKRIEYIIKALDKWDIVVPVLEEIRVLWKILDLLGVWRKAAFEESGEAVTAMDLCKAMDEYYAGADATEDNDDGVEN